MYLLGTFLDQRGRFERLLGLGTATGWHIEYEDASMMDDSPLFVVQIRTTIDGKPYDCGRSEREAAKVACVVKVCQSLKKQ